jgi:hypothetical protein
MDINEKKVWICLLMGSNWMSTGYFFECSQGHQTARGGICSVPRGAGVLVALPKGMCHRGYQPTYQALLHTVSKAKGYQAKYLKELGHAAVDQSYADDIINASTTQGIHNLTLGLLDKERQVLVASMVHKASAITYGEAKEEAVEAHNFSSKVSVTTIHYSSCG